MVETHWEDLAGEEVRYRNHTWELTGDVDVRNRGNLLAFQAEQTEHVPSRTGILHFESVDSDSPNPQDLDERFESLEQENGDEYLRITIGGKTYEYELQRVEHE